VDLLANVYTLRCSRGAFAQRGQPTDSYRGALKLNGLAAPTCAAKTIATSGWRSLSRARVPWS